MRTLIIVLFVGCSVPTLDGSEKTCPCSDGFVCDTMRNRCVEFPGADGGIDGDVVDAVTLDVALDTRVGEDAAPGDGGPPDSALPDADAPDAPGDTALDAAVGCMVSGGIYCTDFEEGTPVPYTVMTSPEGRFSTELPAYRGSRAGHFRAADTDSTAIIQFDPDPLPPEFRVRFWLRVASDTIHAPNIIVNFEVPGGQTLSLRVAELLPGRVSVVFSDQVDLGAFGEFPTDEFVCIRLNASRREIKLRINDGDEIDAVLDLPAGSWQSADFGVFMAPGDAEISIDDLAIGTAAIPCD